MRPQQQSFAFGILLVAITACDVGIDARELTGLYVMNKGQAADSLVVRNDSTYRRVYASPNSPIVVDTRRWSAVNRDGTLQLELSNFPSRWRAETFPSVQLSTPGWFLVAPTRRFGASVRLVVDPDLGWAYVRQSAP